MSMRDELRKEMNGFIAEAVIRDGSTVSLTESYYGWRDSDADFHIRGINEKTRKLDSKFACMWVEPLEPKLSEHYQYEFGDSDNGNNMAVVDLEGVDCVCGKLTNRTIRYAGTLGEFIPKLFFGMDYEPVNSSI